VQTALDAREHGLKATIIPDACATTNARLEETALRYAQDVGGIRVGPSATLGVLSVHRVTLPGGAGS
jgi:nicotinamidase-related amidase